MKLKFFVEDKAIKKFLKDFVAGRFNIELKDDDFYTFNGYAGYKNATTDYERNAEGVSLTFIDADDDFATRQTEILNDFNTLNINSNLFLFPNNKDNGTIENMLVNVAVDKKLISCFEQYEKCIEGYQKPVTKSKVFAYLDALLETNQKKNNRKDLIEEHNRNYRNEKHWDLNTEYLNPLYDFLRPYFSF